VNYLTNFGSSPELFETLKSTLSKSFSLNWVCSKLMYYANCSIYIRDLSSWTCDVRKSVCCFRSWMWSRTISKWSSYSSPIARPIEVIKINANDRRAIVSETLVCNEIYKYRHRLKYVRLTGAGRLGEKKGETKIPKNWKVWVFLFLILSLTIVTITDQRIIRAACRPIAHVVASCCLKPSTVSELL